MKTCFLIKAKILVVYIFPRGGQKWLNYAKRFSALYKRWEPTIPHKLLVVSNGGPPSPQMQKLFSGIPCDWFMHDNTAWDIGAYQKIAKTVPCDLMVCFGASTYFRRAGWLERMVEASQKHGLALYGAMGHKGDSGHLVWPHLRTTSFWFNPSLLNAYPYQITQMSQRYEFEHGRTSFNEWCKAQGIKRLVVTWDGEYEFDDWNNIRNGYHRGNQSNLLTGDRLTEPPFYRIA